MGRFQSFFSGPIGGRYDISMESLITSFIVVVMPGTGVIYTISTGLIRGTHADS
jgi:hypothetical protein